MFQVIRALGSISVPVYPFELTSRLTGFPRRWSSPSLQYIVNLPNLLWWITTTLLHSHLCHPCMNFLHKTLVVWGIMRSHSTRIMRTLFTLKSLLHHMTQCWKCNGFREREKRTQISTTCYKVSGDSSLKETICFLYLDFHIFHLFMLLADHLFFGLKKSNSKWWNTTKSSRFGLMYTTHL